MPVVAAARAGLLILFPILAGPAAAGPPTFETDVQPILTRYGCNQGACHGKARGQNGFQLSLLAFDHDADHAALTAEARGRRVFPASPANSRRRGSTARSSSAWRSWSRTAS